jgi:hypothetical protein
VNDAQPTDLTNFKKEKKRTGTWKLEACCVGSCGGGVAAASALPTSMSRVSDVIDVTPDVIDLTPLVAQPLRTFP